MNWLVIVIVSLFASAFFSGSEIAYISSDRVRAELDVKKGGLISRIINIFYNRSDFFITTILVGNNIMLVIYGMGTAYFLEDWLRGFLESDVLVLLISTLISTGVILLVGEFFPKIIFRINPNSSFRYVSIPLFPIYIILYPITLFVTAISKGIMRLFGIKGQKHKNELLSMGDLNEYIERTIDDNEKQVAIENEVKIFHNALDFSTNHLRDCMIPRNEIKGVDIDETNIEELTQLFVSTGRSKAIVYKEDIDNILGYIHVSELFTASENDWRDRLKPVLFAPETLLSNKMMRRLLTEKKSIAIVVDEFGGTAGMVTLEDLVEEIFGDIEDEHDETGLLAQEIEPGVWDFSARVEIEQINESFHLDLPEEDDYQTLAGYILESTGTIPAKGDVVELPPYKFEIREKQANRLELIRVYRMDLRDEIRLENDTENQLKEKNDDNNPNEE